MTPQLECQIRRLRWIAETERYLIRAREHVARCPEDSDALAVIRTVDDALLHARTEVGVPSANISIRQEHLVTLPLVLG